MARRRVMTGGLTFLFAVAGGSREASAQASSLWR